MRQGRVVAAVREIATMPNTGLLEYLNRGPLTPFVTRCNPLRPSLKVREIAAMPDTAADRRAEFQVNPPPPPVAPGQASGHGYPAP